MSLSKVISLALLCVVLQQCDGMQQVCSFWKGVYYPSPWKNLVFDRHTLQGSKLLYAVCDPSENNSKLHGKTCMLVRDKDEAFQGGNTTCNVVMRTHMRGGALGEKFRVVPFGDDKAILVWIERTNIETKIRLTSIQFSGCTWHEVKVNVDHNFDDREVLENVHLLTYQSTYDVLYGNRRQCGDRYCKLSVDVGNNRVSEPVASFPIEPNTYVVDVKALDSAAKGALVVDTTTNERRFFILQGSAKKVLKVYAAGADSLASSVSNELIAICHLKSGTLNCAQYDQSGIAMAGSSNQLQGNLRVIAIHNLRGGAGLLVLLNNQSENHIHALRIDMRGKPVGKIDIDNFHCDQNQNDVAGNFWEKDEQYCASLACYESEVASKNKSDRGHLSATAKCFSLNSLQSLS